MSGPIRAIIADDHTLFREGLRLLLQLAPDVEVVGEVHRAADLLAAVQTTRCDVLLLDLQMERSSFSDIQPLSKIVPILVLTASERPQDALAAVRHGAQAVVHKRFASETLLDAMRTVVRGEAWLPPALQSEIAKQLREPVEKSLTTREREIVRLVALGLRNGEVAKRLFISEVTVKTHLNNVFQKLDLRDRVELTRYAIRIGLVGIHEEQP